MGAGQEARPDVASVAPKLTVSGALNQPAAFGALDGVADATGAVASYLSAKLAASELPALSRQLPLTAVETMSGPE